MVFAVTYHKAPKPSSYQVTAEVTAPSAVPIFSEDLGALPTSTQPSTDTLHVLTAGASPLDLLSISFPPAFPQSLQAKEKS